MFGKIEIYGVIEVVTGMHIGTSSEFAAIGAVDSPVIRDQFTNKPMIPGSSLKGKMRTLMAKYYLDSSIPQGYNKDPEIILRLFGASEGKYMMQNRLIFSDMFLMNEDDLRKIGISSMTEVKFENTINRITAVANPRQIERTIRGTKFEMNLIYNVIDENQIEEDFRAIAKGFQLLHYDYLGGSGSRGYGKIKINDLEARTVVGNIDESIEKTCNEILKEV